MDYICVHTNNGTLFSYKEKWIMASVGKQIELKYLYSVKRTRYRKTDETKPLFDFICVIGIHIYVWLYTYIIDNIILSVNIYVCMHTEWFTCHETGK